MSKPRVKSSHLPLPHKWRKYELLEDFGLADTNYLKKSIHRIPWSDRNSVLEELRGELGKATQESGSEKNYLFVVKFVPPKLAMMLPNYRVQSFDDLIPLKRALETTDSSRYQEVWFCRTYVGIGGFSVAGRILVDALAGKNAQTIEQVWRCSPRLIEVLDDKFPYPFVRATRSGWAWPPVIAQLHRPPASPETEDIIREQFARALCCLERKRELLETFVERVLSTGTNVCSLEYKIEDDRLQIIDWDTNNDSAVINQLLPDESA
jgi:hypothetical protein